MSSDADEGKTGEADSLIDGGKVMSLLEHLGELRGRVIKSAAAVMVFFFVAWYYATDIILFLQQPLERALNIDKSGLHFTGPMDVFMVSIKVAILTAVVFACPIWLYQFWRFIEPALYKRERRYLLPFMVSSILLFIAGISFSYFIIFPMALKFLLNLGKEVGIPIITITDYTSLVVLMLFGFGFVFEAPLVLIMLGSLDIVRSETLAKHRRAVIVGTLVVGAILTPPDPLSQVGMAVPLYIMYEISIMIIRYLEKKRFVPAVQK